MQRPADKINHALVLGGRQGIGKDTLLEPVKHAVGPWNFHEVSPHAHAGRFNGFVKSVILRVSEARDLGEFDRFKFYDHTKIYTAAPPDVLRVDEKHLREHYVFNCLGSSSPPTTRPTASICRPTIAGITSPGPIREGRIPAGYWNRLWGWYTPSGFGHVAAYLSELDLSGFDAKAPPPKTPAFWEIVDASQAPEDAELADVLDALGNPDAMTLPQLIAEATGEAAEWLMDRRNRRASRIGWSAAATSPCATPDRKDGLGSCEERVRSSTPRVQLSAARAAHAAQMVKGTSEREDGMMVSEAVKARGLLEKFFSEGVKALPNAINAPRARACKRNRRGDRLLSLL